MVDVDREFIGDILDVLVEHGYTTDKNRNRIRSMELDLSRGRGSIETELEVWSVGGSDE